MMFQILSQRSIKNLVEKNLNVSLILIRQQSKRLKKMTNRLMKLFARVIHNASCSLWNRRKQMSGKSLLLKSQFLATMRLLTNFNLLSLRPLKYLMKRPSNKSSPLKMRLHWNSSRMSLPAQRYSMSFQSKRLHHVIMLTLVSSKSLSLLIQMSGKKSLSSQRLHRATERIHVSSNQNYLQSQKSKKSWRFSHARMRHLVS